MQQYTKLRALVAYLGECASPKWWDTAYLNDVGKKYLVVNFLRTSLAAGVNGAGLAAKRLHDERIGRTRVYHLFRFPYDIEERVHDELITSEQETMWAMIASREVALGALRELIDTALDAPEGPVQIGVESDITTVRGVAEIAKHYLSAFETGRVSLPYFRAEGRTE